MCWPAFYYIKYYPDFLLITKKGELIALETKGDDRTSEDSRRKNELGKMWADKAPNGKCSYFMVFKHAPMEGAYSIDIYGDCQDHVNRCFEAEAEWAHHEKAVLAEKQAAL